MRSRISKDIAYMKKEPDITNLEMESKKKGVQIYYVKVKSGKVHNIKKKKLTMDEINAMTADGYAVTRVTKEGNNTRLETYSPYTRAEARGIARAKGLPFS